MNISVFSVVVCFAVAGSVTVEAGVTYKLAILEGETQPGGAVFSDFGSSPGINQSGQILFEGAIGGSTDGLWVMSGSQLDALAVEDADVPGIPGAKFNSFSSGEEGTFLADDGRVLFSSRIKGTGITTTNDLILWSGLPGSLQVVMREASPAPGAPTLNFVAPSAESFTVNPAILREGGVLGFIGQLSGTQTLLNDQRGVWTGTAGQIAPAILSGQTSPHGNIVKVFTSSLGLAPNGDAYVGAATGPQSRGLWHARAGTLTRLYTQGQETPGIEGAVFSLREGVAFENISFFSPEMLSFNCQVNTSEKDLIRASFSGSAAAVNLSLLEGTSAPELGGPVFGAMSVAHANTHGGQVVGCTLQNGIGITDTNNEVLYYIPPGASVAQWQLIAREGNLVPGFQNAFWGGFYKNFIAINASGLVVFQNTLTGTGVPPGTDGIWGWDSATRALTLVAREGSPIDFGGGNVRTPLILTFRGGKGRLNGRTSGLNDRNEIVFQAVGSDYKEMIAVATILADVRITSITRSGNTVTIQGSGVPSATHKLHATNDLLLPFDVNPIATTVADANGIFQFTDNATQARKFYRVAYP